MELDQDSFDQAMKTVANLIVRVLLKGLAVSPTDIRIQVSSEEDVQLYY